MTTAGGPGLDPERMSQQLRVVLRRARPKRGRASGDPGTSAAAVNCGRTLRVWVPQLETALKHKQGLTGAWGLRPYTEKEKAKGGREFGTRQLPGGGHLGVTLPPLCV